MQVHVGHIHWNSFYVIYRFSSISRSTKAIFKFQKLRSLFEIAQNILIDHHFDQWDWGLVLMDECLGLNLYRQQWEIACIFVLCNSTMTEYLAIYHDEALLWYPKKLQSNRRIMPLMGHCWYSIIGCAFMLIGFWLERLHSFTYKKSIISHYQS